MIDTLMMQASELASIVPDPGMGEAPPGAGGLELILRWAFWIGLISCVLGFIVAGIQVVLALSRGEGGQHMNRIIQVCAGTILIGAASALISALISASSE